jgi:hypothetical protein
LRLEARSLTGPGRARLLDLQEAVALYKGSWNHKTRRETMKKQIVRISVLQSSKIVTLLYTLLGFLYTLIGIPMIIFGNSQIQIMGIVYLFGPVFMGILGFIFFVIAAAIYNLLAGLVGGFEFEFRDVA